MIKVTYQTMTLTVFNIFQIQYKKADVHGLILNVNKYYFIRSIFKLLIFS